MRTSSSSSTMATRSVSLAAPTWTQHPRDHMLWSSLLPRAGWWSLLRCNTLHMIWHTLIHRQVCIIIVASYSWGAPSGDRAPWDGWLIRGFNPLKMIVKNVQSQVDLIWQTYAAERTRQEDCDLSSTASVEDSPGPDSALQESGESISDQKKGTW